jgi:all-trans-retinol dehydrogenase (NAD+)
MISEKRGHIVTVGSVMGLFGTYACCDYSATKFACIGFHESLFCELQTHGHDYVNLTLVCPSYIATPMFTGVKARLMDMLEPKYVADTIVKSVQLNRVNCVLPDSIRVLSGLKW